MPRHFLRDDDLSPAEQAAGTGPGEGDEGQIARPSARSPGRRRSPCSSTSQACGPAYRSTVGVAELGGLPLEIDTTKTHIGRGETIADIARVLTRQVAAITWRTSGQDRIEELAGSSTVPVINALTDEFHPCQVLADLQTVTERLGSLAGRTFAYVGDGANNMAHSYLLGGATAGMHVRVAAPHGYLPDPAIVARAQHIAARTAAPRPCSTTRPSRPRAADVLATDVWVSMGQADAPERKAALGPYQVNDELLALAAQGAIVLHCLPAHRGEEITAEALDGPASVVWDQAENRLHAQKALLAWLLEQS